MSYHLCVSGCDRCLVPQDGHVRCLTCLGIKHTEEAFVDGACSLCGDMTILELHKRLKTGWVVCWRFCHWFSALVYPCASPEVPAQGGHGLAVLHELHTASCVQKLKDMYFHVSILLWHSPFLHFPFEGGANQYKALPFSLSLLPHVFTKVAEAARSARSVCILNYLDDSQLARHLPPSLLESEASEVLSCHPHPRSV